MSATSRRTRTIATRTVLARIALTKIGILQVVFAFLAAWDLWHRSDREVNGPRLAWAPALLVNWIGPAAYFLFGIKR